MSKMIEPTWTPLRCTRCGGPLSVEYVYDGHAYSEFRSVESFECDCGATWDAQGTPMPTTWLRELESSESSVDADPPAHRRDRPHHQT
jgi:hypothetical protein